MVKRTKTSNLTKYPEEYTKSYPYVELINAATAISVPGANNWFEKLAFVLNEWSKQDDATMLRKFYDKYGIRKCVFKSFVKQSPLLQAEFEEVKDRIASRLIDGATLKKYDREIVLREIHKYDAEEFELTAKLSKISKENSPENTDKYIVINQMPDSELVPVRKIIIKKDDNNS